MRPKVGAHDERDPDFFVADVMLSLDVRLRPHHQQEKEIGHVGDVGESTTSQRRASQEAANTGDKNWWQKVTKKPAFVPPENQGVA